MGISMSDCLETSAETKFYKWTALFLKDYLALEQETAELFINEVLLSKERHSWFIFHGVFKP